MCFDAVNIVKITFVSKHAAAISFNCYLQIKVCLKLKNRGSEQVLGNKLVAAELLQNRLLPVGKKQK